MTRHPTTLRRRPVFRPQLESLEDRAVPATANQVGDTIVINGLDSAESITITDNGTNKDNAITITGITNVFTFSQAALPGADAAARRSTVVKVRANLGGGNDILVYRFTNDVNYNSAIGTFLTNADADFSGGRFVDVNLGTGRDLFSLTGQRTNGALLIAVNTYLEWIVRGQAGNDTLGMSFDALVQGTQLLFVAAGQRGNNRVGIAAALDRLRNADLADGVDNLMLPAASGSFIWTEVYGGSDGGNLFGLVVTLPNDIPTLRQLISGRDSDFAVATVPTQVRGIPAARILFLDQAGRFIVRR